MKYLDVPQSGSQADTVASRNRFGQYYRTRAIPTNPATDAQSIVRSRLGERASLWAGLTASIHAGWQACADRFPKTDSLGQTIKLSGFQQFIRSNTALGMVGVLQLEPAQDTTFSANNIEPTVSAAPPKAFTIAYPMPAVGQWLFIDASPMVSNGISYWSDYRNLAIQSSAGPSPAEELAKYELKFGPLIGGKKIFFRCRCLNECGVFGPAYYISTIVTPAPPLPRRNTLPAAEGKKKG